jgi:hypothetical protein
VAWKTSGYLNWPDWTTDPAWMPEIDNFYINEIVRISML